MRLDPKTRLSAVRPDPRHQREDHPAAPKADIADQDRSRISSPHHEIMAIHAKFSIPAACLVFALIALALGLSVARDGKLAGFVVGIVVIFAYYILIFLAESVAKGPPDSAPNRRAGSRTWCCARSASSR